MKMSSVSRMQRFMYSQILCYVLQRWIRTQHQMLFGSDIWDGSKIQHNRRRTNGIRVNIFPGFTTLQLVDEVQKFMSKMSEPEQFQGRIIFMPMFNDIIWWFQDNETECIADSTLVSIFCKKDFQQDVGHSSDLDQKRSGILLTTKDHEENGTESLNWWWSNSEKADTQFSEQRVRSLEECSKPKEVENYRYTSVPMVIRLKLFFAPSFLSISSVTTEQSQICVKHTVAVEQEQEDLLWQSSLIHFSRQQTCS